MSSNKLRRIFKSCMMIPRRQNGVQKMGRMGMNMITTQTFTAGIAYVKDPRQPPLDTTTVEVYLLHHPHSHHIRTPV